VDLIPYWIQRADFSATEHEPVDVAAAQALLESHDWDAELALRDALEAAGDDVCDPGIGFLRADGEVLHLCPTPGDRACVHYHYRVKQRVLGLLPITRHAVRSKLDVPRSALPHLVERWFAADHAALLAYLQEGPTD